MMFRIVVTGSRDWKNRTFIHRVLWAAVKKYGELHIMQGGCDGADLLAHKVVTENLEMVSTTVPAKWRTGKGGRSEGPKRNVRMLQLHNPHLVIAFHDNMVNSLGTRNMLKEANDRGIPNVLFKGEELDIVLPDMGIN